MTQTNNQDNRFTKNNKEDGKTMKYSDDWKDNLLKPIIEKIEFIYDNQYKLEDMDKIIDILYEVIAKTEEHLKKQHGRECNELIVNVVKMERKAFALELRRLANESSIKDYLIIWKPAYDKLIKDFGGEESG